MFYVPTKRERNNSLSPYEVVSNLIFHQRISFPHLLIDNINDNKFKEGKKKELKKEVVIKFRIWIPIVNKVVRYCDNFNGFL